MKKVLTLIAFSLGSLSVFSQQDPQFSQFMHNKLFMNPGYAGMNHALCFTGIARQQWAGFDGSPRSGIFSADCYVPQLSGGIGVNMMYDQLGFETNMGYRLNYSFHRDLGRGVLGMGVEMGAYSKRIGPGAGEQWTATTNWQIDPTIPPQLRTTVMDMGLGLWYERENMWCGISTSHLNGKLINDGTVLVDTIPHPMLYQMARHYFITGGVNLLPGHTWEIRPSFIVKSDATITSFDLNVTAMFNHTFWFGASYRSGDAICPMIGFQLVQKNGIFYSWIHTEANQPQLTDDQRSHQGGTLKMGFAYDYTTSHLKNYNNGTFELFVNYCMPIEWKVKKEGHGDVRIIDRPDQP